jgi:hypothetical protein
MELEGQTSIDDLLETVSLRTITADTETGPAFTTREEPDSAAPEPPFGP